MRYFMLLLTLCFLTSVQSIAGTVKGKVTDTKTGEPLTGATVELQKGDKKRYTIVNLDGSYIFKNVAEGAYTIEAKTVGFKSSDDQKISVDNASSVVVIDIQMSEKGAVLNEVVVSANMSRSTDEGVRRLEKNSSIIQNILSERAIQLSPDITVANSLQRVSGVTIERSSSGEGRYAIIRGMDQRYNNTLVNGIKIPSPDDKFRYVPMDIFPADMLERLEVTKSLTPDMEGDAIGGTMNLVMKNAPRELFVNAFVAGGFNSLFNDRSFLTFDHSVINKKDPAQINGRSYVARYSDFTKGNVNFTHKDNPINKQAGFTFGNRLLNKKIGVVVGVSYQDMFRGSDNVFNRQNPQPEVIANLNGTGQRYDNYPAFNDGYIREYSTRQKRYGLNNKWDYVINDRNKLSLFNLFIHMDELQSRYTIDSSLTTQRTGPGSGNVAILYRSRWQIQDIYNSTLQGDHQLSSAFKLNWSAVYSIAKQNIPDQSEFEYDNEVKNNIPQAPVNRLAGMSRIWTHNSDRDLAGYLNLTWMPHVANTKTEVKFGGLYRHKNRENYYNLYDLSAVNAGQQQFTDINAAQYEFTSMGKAISNEINVNTYTSREDISAAYVQVKFMLSKNLQVLGGMRAEHTDQHYNTVMDSTFDKKDGHIWYTDLLPSVHFKYSLDAKQNLRLSYFRSLSRPGFFEVTPYNRQDEYYNQKGNPDLKHTTADNLDFRYEYFPTNTDQILAGVFYKRIHNPVEYGLPTRAQPHEAVALMPYNFGDATNYGFEAVYIKYIGKFGININYTYTQSKITTTKSYRLFNNASNSDTTTTLNQTRPLQGQANHVGNMALLYKNGKIGLDAQLAFVYTGERIVQVSPYYGLDVWQRPYNQLDFSFEKKIARRLFFYTKINNLINSKTNVIIKQPYIKDGTPGQLSGQDDYSSIFVQRDIYKRSYLFGLRFKL